MSHRSLSNTRVALAFAVAFMADLIQLPLSAGFATVILSLFAFIVIVMVDFFALIATLWLLGFHWALLSSILVEIVPGINVFPTWTACVAYVVWSRKNEEGQASNAEASRQAQPLVIDVPPASQTPAIAASTTVAEASQP